MLKELEALAETRYISSYHLAAVHVALGDENEAFRLLAKAFDVKAQWLYKLAVDPRFIPLRDDPRWAPLVERLRL